jgi:putative cell wall-binding protein
LTTRTWRAKRQIGAAALVALIGSTLAFASSASAVTPGGDAESYRLAGDNRYATAADIFLDDVIGWDMTDSTSDVVVVNGENFPDGLSAAIYGMPILLVRADSIPAETSAALTAAEASATGDVGEIIVVGGTSVVSSAVLEQLDGLNGTDNVKRVAGADRHATAAAVAADWLGLGGDTCNMILATGANFPDALAAGPLADAAGAPILLNTGASLVPSTKAAITSKLVAGGDCLAAVGGVPTIHIVGGTSAVPASVESELQSMGINVVRWAGDNRAETAATIAGVVGLVDGFDHINLVNGNGFADALGAGPIAAANFGVILLTNATSIPAETAAFHVVSCDDLTWDPQVVAIGGTAVISDAVLAAADVAATCVPPIASATLTTLSQTQAKFEITDDDDGGDVDPGEGISLTAVAGSATDGAAGNSWIISIVDSGGLPTGATSDVTTKTVTLSIKGLSAAGISQADLVALWNGTAETSALFSAAVNGTTGSPVDYDGSDLESDLTTTVGKTTQQIVVTFNQQVDDCQVAPADDVLDAGYFGFPNVNVPAFHSPLPNTAGSSDVYTYTFVLTDAAKVMVGGATGDTMSVINACSVANDLTQAVYPGNATVKFG